MGFAVIILIIGGLLVWNNRSLSFAGTIDGDRMPIEHFNFYRNQAWQTLVFSFGWPNDDETEAWATASGFERLTELHLTTRRAAEFGFSVADVDADEVQEHMELLRTMLEAPDFDAIAALGFTNTSFREFVELQMLHELVYRHITDLVTIDEEEMAEAFEQHLIDSFMEMNQVLVYMIEVETQERADALLRALLVGDDFVELMREHSVAFDEDMLELDEVGQPILTMDVFHTPLAWDEELLEVAYALEIGEISGILELPTGNFAIVQAVEINEIMTREMMEAEFMPMHEERLRDEYFRERLGQWAEEAEIVQNNRIFG
jgi:hypothetical protein